jgi:hypothetical protein
MSSINPDPTTDDAAQQVKRFLQGGGQVSLKEIEAIKAQAGAQATVERPGVVTFPTTLDHINTALAGAASRRTTIELEFAGVTSADRVSASIFLNNPNVSVRTPIEHPSFAGAVSFFVHMMAMDSSMVMPDTLLYVIDVTDVVKRLGRNAGQLTASVVLQALPRAAVPNGIAIKSSTLRVLDSTVKRSS